MNVYKKIETDLWIQRKTNGYQWGEETGGNIGVDDKEIQTTM